MIYIISVELVGIINYDSKKIYFQRRAFDKIFLTIPFLMWNDILK